jgi:NTP pyrophosphatase (non-canonical NTP hydrolase)
MHLLAKFAARCIEERPDPGFEDYAMDEIVERLRRFTVERNWGQFHTPKNLAMALNVEAGELLELFQWLTPEQSAEPEADVREQIADELADVFVYCLLMSDKLDIDLLAATRAKMAKNEAKYPADLVRGSAKKYSDY